MKKNGFTLAELLGVMIILSIIALITFPIITDSFDKSTDKLSKEQKKSLENIARIWATKNSDELNEENPRYVTIEELKRSGLLENKDIIDVEDYEELKGCIKVYYESNKYNYKYDNYEECN